MRSWPPTARRRRIASRAPDVAGRRLAPPWRSNPRHSDTVARLPYVDPADAPEPVREALEAVPVQLNVFRMLAHASTAFRPFLRLGTAILGELELDARLRELAILRVARLTPAEYEWVQHVDIGKAVGVSDEQVAALERDDTEAACFDDSDRLVLAFTTEVVERARASDETLDAMRARFSPREIVELIVTIGYYMAIARVMETAGVDVEPGVGSRVADAATRAASGGPEPPSTT